MHLVLADIVAADRGEGAQTDIETDLGDLEREGGSQALQRFLVEVQARGRGGQRSHLAPAEGAVVFAVAVLSALGAADIGRQRHVTQRVDGFQQIGALRLEAELDVGAVFGFDHGAEPVTEMQAVAGLELLARAGVADPECWFVGFCNQRHFDTTVEPLPVALALADQAAGEDLAVVEHQQVAIAQAGGEVGEGAVHPAAVPPYVQQACCGTGVNRALGDQCLGQAEIEVAKPHSCCPTGQKLRRSPAGTAPAPPLRPAP